MVSVTVERALLLSGSQGTSGLLDISTLGLTRNLVKIAVDEANNALDALCDTDESDED
jgi:hypothetical protein